MQLHETGHVVLAPPEAQEPPDRDLSAAVRDIDRLERLNAPGRAPPLDEEAATWAAHLLHQLCQCLAYRDIPAEAVQSAAAQPCPTKLSASVIWSVDLFLRHLPDLLRLARPLASGDPLVAALRQLGRQWPLSSVGIDEPCDDDRAVNLILGNACLAQLYVDRILHCQDTARAADPRLEPLLAGSLGLYRNLCPAVAGLMKDPTDDAAGR